MRIALLSMLSAVWAPCQDFEQVWRGERLVIRMRSGAIGNLSWQLDTLAGKTNTAPKDYEDLWRKDLEWNAADGAWLARWKKLHARHRKPGESNRPNAPYPPNYARAWGRSVSRDYEFRIAALDAADFDSLRRSYAARCGKACADDMIAVLRHFWPRFSRWWDREGLPYAKTVVPLLERQMSEFRLGELCEFALELTAADVPARHDVALDIAVHPKRYLSNYTATVMENHVLSEVVDHPEVGGPKLPLMIHELTHHFYDFAPRESQLRLIGMFSKRPEPWAMSAYSVLNEALATAMQLVVEKRMRTAEDYAKHVAEDGNIYDDPFIAKSGRAAAPVVERWIAEKRAIFSEEFVAAYLEAVRPALGPSIDSPRFLLSSRVLIADKDAAEARAELTRSVRGITGMDSWDAWKAYPAVGGAILMTRAGLSGLRRGRGVLPGELISAVTASAKTRPGFALAWPRSSGMPIYFLYGEDRARLLAVTREFANSDKPAEILRVNDQDGSRKR